MSLFPQDFQGFGMILMKKMFIQSLSSETGITLAYKMQVSVELDFFFLVSLIVILIRGTVPLCIHT